MKNKIEIQTQIDTIEASHKVEVQKLRDLLDEPEKREPKNGDIYEDLINGQDLLIIRDHNHRIHHGFSEGAMSAKEISEDVGGFRFLGTFDEVYIKRSEIEAMLLSNLQTIEDDSGDQFKHPITWQNSSQI